MKKNALKILGWIGVASVFCSANAGPLDPPAIVEQPKSLAIMEGQPARWQVVADGTGNLTYQWYFNGQALPGADSDVLAFANATLERSGVYLVAVSNHAGTTFSVAAVLTISARPIIAEQPRSQTVSPGQTIALEVTAFAHPEPSYWWALNGEYIPGATGRSLVISDAQAADGGVYTVTVHNEFGITDSTPAHVLVDVPVLPFADRYPDRGLIESFSGVGRTSNVNGSRDAGEPRHAGKPGKSSMWISWRAPATGIATVSLIGSQIDTLLGVYLALPINPFSEVASDDESGGYHTSVVSFNAKQGAIYNIAVAGFNTAEGVLVMSWHLQPTLEILPLILSRPKSQTVAPGKPVLLGIEFGFPGQIDCQWYKDAEPILGAVGKDLFITGFQSSDVGAYQVVLSRAGQVLYTSPPAELQLNTEGLPLGGRNRLADSREAGLRANSLRLASSAGDNGASAPNRRARRAFETFVGYSGTQIFSTYPGKDPDEPHHCGVVGGASYWFSWQAPAAGVMKINTDGSYFDTILAVYTAQESDEEVDEYEDLMSVTCDDNSGLDHLDSAIVFNTAGGRIYYVVVDGKWGATGKVYLNYSFNNAPVISSIHDQTTQEDKATPAISFMIGDRETPASSLQVYATSSNPTLVPVSYITLTGTEATRYVTVRPAANKFGSATVTIVVRDGGGTESSESFTVTVTSVNDPPVAYGDSATRYPDKSIRFRISALLRNDVDVDGDPLAHLSNSSTSYMGATIRRSGDYLVYTAPWGMNSSDYFGYSISDGKGGYSCGIVSVRVSSYYATLSVE
ncbi:MAG: immunoglobulin domain-containing protein [Verrucomicrobiota bacterium]